MRLKTDARVISFCLRRGEQDYFRLLPKLRLSETNQLATDSLLLVGAIDSQIRKIAAILEIGDRTRDTDQLLAIPSGAKEIRVGQHCSNAFEITYRPAFRQGRTLQEIDEFNFVNHPSRFIADSHF